VLRQRGELRAAGIREPEQLGALVEGLAGGIVAGLAEQAVIAECERLDEHGVSAGDQQRQVRKFRGAGDSRSGASRWPSR
jgi:hypothetical protein